MSKENIESSTNDPLGPDVDARAAMDAAFAEIDRIDQDTKGRVYDPEEHRPQEERDTRVGEEKEPETIDIEEEAEENIFEPKEDKEEAEEVKTHSKKEWNPSKERYQLRAQLIEKEKENARLKELLSATSNLSAKNYAKVIQSDVDKASIAMNKAIEADDRQAFIEAQKELQRAIYREQEMQKWNVDQEYSAPTPIQSQEQAFAPQGAQEANPYVDVIQDWQEYVREAHPELVDTSKYYNKDLRAKVEHVMNDYDRQLRQMGYGNMIGSPEYFSNINREIDALQSVYRRSQVKKQPAAAPVSGVKHGATDGVRGVGAAKKTSPKAVTLTSDIQQMLGNLNAAWVDKNEIKKSWARGLSREPEYAGQIS